MSIEVLKKTGEVLFAYEESRSLINALEKACSDRANLRNADLRNADLSGAYLSGADLRNANLIGANLRNAYLSGAYLSGADLRNADLRNADLSGANLRNAYLIGADLSGADLSGADLSGANLRNAYLIGADIKCMGDMRHIFSLQLDTWQVGFTKIDLQIGCQRHPHAAWRTFNDTDIRKMHPDALVWWNKWKDFIFQAVALTIKEGE